MTEQTQWPVHSNPTEDSSPDHFISTGTSRYAGRHLILDVWQGEQLNNLSLMEDTLRQCVTACNATLLHIHLHHFNQNGGISGVAVLAESHISVHTWPEHNYAAFDIFMCGDAIPENAVPIIQKAFQSPKVDLKTLHRGLVETPDQH